MRTKIFLLLLLLLNAPRLTALSTEDLAIEDAARASFNLRTVLDRRVRVKAHEGHVTLYGSVLDDDARQLAIATVAALPGVADVTCEVELEGRIAENSDAWLAAKIRSRLLARNDVSAFNTSVTVRDGIAILAGSAPTPFQKELTATYAAGISGVKSVTNNIVVQPYRAPLEQLDDASISAHVKLALLAEPATAALQTTISTSAGVVRLGGQADSPAQKAAAATVARTIRGATAIDNELTVKL